MEHNRPEIWIGLECTINRLHLGYRDQCAYNGHYARDGDLALFQGLGAKRLRYPFLWERAGAQLDLSVFDKAARELFQRGIRPIAGLLHHGSGPSPTSLLDPDFPNKFSAYAAAFASRFPWIEDYTPINEPLTTARFSALYGAWYPHHRSDRSFARAITLEAKATILAMEEIRKVQPKARLIQTEDLGRATGTSGLSKQIAWENERRWLSFDLLTGKVSPHTPCHEYLTAHGVREEELEWVQERACLRPSDILGINHYLLSNRFLDEELQHYPRWLHGGNGHQEYADVGAVDSGRATTIPPYEILREAWKRYERPLAVTEVHLNGSRESQLRWLHEVWSDACRLRQEGVPMEAVTAWSLLGSFDWNTLCTSPPESPGLYEPGVFDLRAPSPRPTALHTMTKNLALAGSHKHPLLDQPGWWKNPAHALYAPARSSPHPEEPRGQPLLISGASGTLGKAFGRICRQRQIPFALLARQEMDIADPASVRNALEALRPWAVVNAAGFVRMEEAEENPERCFRENVIGAEILAQECDRAGIPLLGFSSDMVFGGDSKTPYLESHPVNPLNVYGHSKAEAERRTLAANPRALVVRTSSFFGPWDPYNFVTLSLRSLLSGEEWRAPDDLVMSPTYVPALVHQCLDLLIDEERGIFHLTAPGALSWKEFAEEAALGARKSLGRELPGRILGLPARDLKLKAPRPKFSALSTERTALMPTLAESLERYFLELEVPLETRKEGSVA